MYNNHGMGGVMWLWTMLGILLVIALVIWIVRQSKKT